MFLQTFIIIVLIFLCIFCSLSLYYFLKKKKCNDTCKTENTVVPIKNRFQKRIKTTGFVTYNPTKQEFEFNGQRLVATGVNITWLGYSLNSPGFQECGVPTPHERIDNILTYCRNTLNVNVIRCFTLGFPSFTPNSLLPEKQKQSDTMIKINDNFWDSLDYTIATAKRLGLFVIPVLSDQYAAWMGNYDIFLGPNEKTQDFFNISSQAYKNYTHVLSEYLNHKNKYLDNVAIKDEPTIFGFQYINEAGDHSNDGTCRSAFTSTCAWNPSYHFNIPTTSCLVPTQEWITAIIKFTKSIDANHMLAIGTDWCNFSIGSDCSYVLDEPDVSFVDYHWYFTDKTLKYDAIQKQCKEATDKQKACLVAEVQSHYPEKYSDFLDTMNNWLSQNIIQGLMFWELYDEQGIAGGCDEKVDGCIYSPKYDTLLTKWATLFLPFKFNHDSPPSSCQTLDLCQKTCGSVSDKYYQCEGTTCSLCSSGQSSTCKYKNDNTCNGQCDERKQLIMFVIGDSVTTGYHCANCAYPGACANQTTYNGNLDKLNTTTYTIDKSGYQYTNNCSLSYIEPFLQNILQNMIVYNFAIQGKSAADCYLPQYGNIQWSKYNNIYNDFINAKNYLIPDYIYISLGANDLLYKCNNCENQPIYNAIADLITNLAKVYDTSIFIFNRPFPLQNAQNCSIKNFDSMSNMGIEVKKLLKQPLSNRCFFIDIYDDIKNSPEFGNYCDEIHPLKDLNNTQGKLLAKAISKLSIGLTYGLNPNNPPVQVYYDNPQCKSQQKTCTKCS